MADHFDDGSVAYLEDEDFDPQGNLTIDTGGKPACVMLQGSFCGYCTQMKPEYQRFAHSLGDRVFMATVLIDGNESEKNLNKRLPEFLPNYRGVPIVLGYDGNGKYVATHDGERTATALAEFVQSL